MVNKPKRIGTSGESAVVRYAQAHGFPHAERRTLGGAGYGQDRGDVLLTVGAIAQVKAGKYAKAASYPQVLAWLDDTERQRVNANADIALLIVQRAGYGTERVGMWSCWWMETFPFGPVPACVTLENGLLRLRWSGWGDAL